MNKNAVIESLGHGIEGYDNSLVFVGPSNDYTVSSSWTFYFNGKSRVKKVIFTTLHNTRALARMQADAMKRELESNGFEYISDNKMNNGEREP